MPLRLTFVSSGRDSVACTANSATAIPASINVASSVVVSPRSASSSGTATTAPESRSTACSALWARCVRPSFIFAIRASSSIGLFHSLFDVRLDDVLQVQRGEVAVVVSNVGKDPADLIQPAPETMAEPPTPEERLKLGVERYVVESGYRGIQREVLGPGTYNINRLAFTPHIIPTTNITI